MPFPHTYLLLPSLYTLVLKRKSRQGSGSWVTPGKSHEKKSDKGTPLPCCQCPHQRAPTFPHQLTPSFPHPKSTTYIFFNVLRFHSLVGIICRVKGAKYKPGGKRERKKEKCNFPSSYLMESVCLQCQEQFSKLQKMLLLWA